MRSIHKRVGAPLSFFVYYFVLSAFFLTFALMKAKYVLFLLLLALCSCTTEPRRAEMRARLQALNALNRADSVLTATNRDEAQVLADFFDRHGIANEQLLAHYLLGRCYADMHEAPMALHCYQEAISRADTTAADCDFAQLSRVYGQSATIFYQQGLYRNALEFQDLCFDYGWRGKDTLNALLSYAKMASSYDKLQSKDSAIYVYRNAIRQLKLYKYNKVAAGFSGTFAKELIEKGEMVEAEPYIQDYEQHSGYFDSAGNIARGREVYYYAKGLYYLKLNQLDSAYYYFHKELRTGKDFNNQRAGAYGLSMVYLQRHLPDSTAKYALLYSDLNDSCYAQRSTHEVEQAKAMYDYSRQQEVAQKEREKAAHLKYYLLLSILFIVIILFVSVVIGINIAHKKKLLEEKISLLRGYAVNENLRNSAIALHFRELLESVPYRQPELQDWKELASAIDREVPDFRAMLSKGDVALSDFEYDVCMLIKLQIPLSDISRLKQCTPSYITQIRKTIFQKLFNRRGKADELDEYIMKLS